MRFRGMAVGLLVSGAVPAPGMSGTVAYGAETLGFTGVAGSATDMAIGERQFFVDVISTGARETTFRFTNVGTVPSSIVATSFDDQGSGDGGFGPVLPDPDDIACGHGVSFTAPAVSADFPFPTLGQEFVLTSNMPFASNLPT